MAQEEQAKKKKTGRPKGSKSNIGIPMKGIKEAISLTKMAYEKGKDSIMSFSEISGHMGLQKGSNTTTMGALSAYGFVEQSEGGWKVSELGKRAINGEKEAIRASFEKVDLFRELSSQFGGKNVSPGLVIDYLKKKYKKGENVKIIEQRFSEGMDFIKGLEPEKPQFKSVKTDAPEIIDLIKLKYALHPPEEKDIKELANKVHLSFKDNQDPSIKILAENINKNKENKGALLALVDSILGILNQ
jgi:hypothetical protein